VYVSGGRAIVAEFIGTAFLLAAVVGSGIMADRLCGGNVGLALLANAVATGGTLIALILTFGPVSGGHFNPAVTVADAWCGGVAWPLVLPYAAAQLAGAIAGTGLANGMFGLPLFFASHHERSGGAMLVSEFVATFGLVAVILGCVRSRPVATPYAVAAYIVGAYWFTPSTSFANPAVTIARSLTDTFAGIRPSDAPPFVVAQLLGALAATALFAYLMPAPTRDARDRPALERAVRPRRGQKQVADLSHVRVGELDEGLAKVLA
jgi:glycerol uptake facilitator-like aquaporin